MLSRRKVKRTSKCISASVDLCVLVEMWFVEVRIRMPGIVKFEKQTDGTRRRTLRSDPDVESGFKRADNAKGTIPYFRKRT